MTKPTKLTEREKWLMQQAYSVSRDYLALGQTTGMLGWLTDVVDDQGHTVEMWLAGSAPKADEVGK